MAHTRFAHTARARRRRRRTRLTERLFALLVGLVIVLVFGAQALPVLEGLGLAGSRSAPPARTDIVAEAPATRFPLCAGSNRHTCVVDGDTFWYAGETIRIADINTPETGRPHCAAEAALGAQATRRLVDLLEAGPFALARSGSRDTDAYGRKLRVVLRDGRSLGDTLVAERLAHPWRGYQESWC